MKLVVNGAPRESGADTLFELWQQEVGIEHDPRRGFAIALNGALVPHHEWEQTRLRDEDRVEIVLAMQGG